MRTATYPTTCTAADAVELTDAGCLLRIVHVGMEKSGVDVAAISHRLGYDAGRLPLRSARIGHRLQIAFWEAAEAVSGDQEIGLRLGPHLPGLGGDILEYLLLSAPSFGDGLLLARKYLRLLSDAIDIQLEKDSATARVLMRGSSLSASALRHTDFCLVQQIIRLAAAATDGYCRPLRVRLRFGRRLDAVDYIKLLGCPVDFDACNSEVWFDPSALSAPAPRWDPQLFHLHVREAERRLSALHRQDLIEKLRRLLDERMEFDDLQLEDAAVRLGVPVRRLRFELALAGTSFSSVYSELRFARARRMLTSSELTIEQIGRLAGFNGPSTFHRAFRRWSGMTPCQYREHGLQRQLRQSRAVSTVHG